jgi:hypothetical protein
MSVPTSVLSPFWTLRGGRRGDDRRILMTGLSQLAFFKIIFRRNWTNIGVDEVVQGRKNIFMMASEFNLYIYMGTLML